jgi:hypothetical protein
MGALLVVPFMTLPVTMVSNTNAMDDYVCRMSAFVLFGIFLGNLGSMSELSRSNVELRLSYLVVFPIVI